MRALFRNCLFHDNRNMPAVTEGVFQQPLTCATDSVLMCNDFNHDATLIAVGSTSGTVTVCQTSTGLSVYQLPSPGFDRLPVTAVKFHKKSEAHRNILLSAHSSGHVAHWHVTTSQCLSTLTERRQTLAADIAPDGLTFATTGSDSKVLVYDEPTQTLVRSFQSSHSTTVMDGHVSRVFALVFHPSDPCLLASAGWDDAVLFWDTRQEHAIRRISGPHICGSSLDIEETTLNVLTGSWRYHDCLEVWDFNSGNRISCLQQDFKTKVYGSLWIDDETILAAGTEKNQAVLVNTTSDKVLGSLTALEHGVYSVGYSSLHNLAAITAGSDLLLAPLKMKSHTFLTQED